MSFSVSMARRAKGARVSSRLARACSRVRAAWREAGDDQLGACGAHRRRRQQHVEHRPECLLDVEGGIASPRRGAVQLPANAGEGRTDEPVIHLARDRPAGRVDGAMAALEAVERGAAPRHRRRRPIGQPAVGAFDAWDVVAARRLGGGPPRPEVAREVVERIGDRAERHREHNQSSKHEAAESHARECTRAADRRRRYSEARCPCRCAASSSPASASSSRRRRQLLPRPRRCRSPSSAWPRCRV